MEDKQENMFKVKYGDNMIEITPSLLKRYLTKREGKTLVRLLLKQDGKSSMSERDQFRIGMLLSKLELNILSNMEENKTDEQKKKLENLFSVHSEIGKRLRVVSMFRKLLLVFAILAVGLMTVVLSGWFSPTIYNIFLIASLFVNIFVAVFMIYCKEQIWNWKSMKLITKIIWWSVLLVNMSFAAKSVLKLWSLIK